MCKSITNLLYRKLIFKEKNKIICFSSSPGRHLFQTEIRVDFRKPNKMRLLFFNQNRISDIHVLPKFSEFLKFHVFFLSFQCSGAIFFKKSVKSGALPAVGRHPLKPGSGESSLRIGLFLNYQSSLIPRPRSKPL